ncbi:MAG: alanine racemase [Gemmatimonadetes bacterium]|nr:alanine racemase [Gemmatimonadota bacterium]
MPPVEFPDRAWVEVDLGALVRNAQACGRRSRAPLLPMIKADAYGLGAVPVARALESVDPWGYGVATIAEADELRRAGISRPILLVAPMEPNARVIKAMRAARVTPALGDATSIRLWMMTGAGDWHLSIDTGMHRAGVRWDAVDSLADELRSCPPSGAFTHLHSAELDDGSMQVQLDRFESAVARLPVRPALLHAENSAAIERTSPSAFGLARPGVFLYGVPNGGALVPESVASMRAAVVDIHDLNPGDTVGYDATWTATRPSRIATLAAGYADGYRRVLGNKGTALVRGARVPVVGTVTMDMTMVDVTGLACERGDIATLIGPDGDEVITVSDVAAAAGLSPYEILTSLRARLPRVYL